MSVETSGPAAALARMAAIQSTIASVSGTATRSASSTAGATSFDAVYGSALEGAGAASGAQLGTAGGGGQDVGSQAVAAASQYLGVPYVWGGTDPRTGLDCSGLVQRAYADVGVSLPRVAADQARMGTAVPSLAQAQPGDILAFNSPVTHIAIYVGNGKMIAAPKAGDVVKVQDVYKTPSAIRRIGPTVGAGGVSGTAGLAGLAATGAASTSATGAPAALQSLFASATARYGLPQGLLTAVAKAESGFDTRAVSPAGALGLMQLMPATARGLGVDPMVPAQAVDGAARMLSRDLARFGSVGLAVAAYNAGAGAVQRYGGVPPYPETQQYVRRVLGSMGVS
ncbi:transglycosylase SLT domain-containing protein [Phycicoccus sonneratiae]|uniref:Transglycosylase SLT domain-containing protein n=1 Tax=Phycicoccus sonneratiae TaxID=2807628 RepID=A0ABS2CNJ8_9MICO|nr:transglycosylase SLT domain-containing protein [Phycicoccus sonneraticus]MBM6401459.1 transglycosylase SLT domain-containing protein [Phycicoccus sonneraticus]